MRIRRFVGWACGGIALLLASGCASFPHQITYQLPEQYQRLGHAEGSACGVLLFGFSPLQFIPALTTSRVERAYDNALKSVPGALYLDGMTIDEYYFWLFGTVWCTRIEGEAVR